MLLSIDYAARISCDTFGYGWKLFIFGWNVDYGLNIDDGFSGNFNFDDTMFWVVANLSN